MQDVLKILLQLRAEGTIGEFAIGGAIALQTGRAKAAWRKHAQSLSWEQKVAAIERMWVREAEMKQIRERNLVSKKAAGGG